MTVAVRHVDGEVYLNCEFLSDETLDDIWDEIQPLIQDHAHELNILPPEYPVAPEKEKYQNLERMKLTRLFTMRLAGRLVGYSLYFLNWHMHIPSTRWALQDSIYVVPEHRGRRAMAFMLYMEDVLQWEVDVIYRHVNLNQNYGRTLERMGYEPIEIGYRKILRGPR